MDKLQEKKDYYRKYKGLEMDDLQIAAELKELQKAIVSDEDVVNHLTIINHLALRVKNVAVQKLT